MTDPKEARLAGIVRASPLLMEALEGCRRMDLPQWLIASGAVYQSVWNHVTGRAPDYGLKDFDLFYFHAEDISYAHEDAIIKGAARFFRPEIAPLVEIRNQARVHVWFEAKFGEPYPPLRSSAEALSRFVSPAFAVGVRLDADDRLHVEAPFGLEDVFALRVRPNPNRPRAARFDQIAHGVQARWPEVRVED